MSNADKRTVSTDALETLGTIIGENEKRDAIHLAVLPVYAGHPMRPGDQVGLVDGVATEDAPKLIGIVDPFLQGRVKKGQRFWLVIYPRKINSLRHVWTHPDVDDAQDAAAAPPSRDALKANAEQKMRELADSVGISFGRLLEAAKGYLEDGDWLTGGAEMEGESVPDSFWEHYQIYTGEVVAEDKRGNFFSCSC